MAVVVEGGVEGTVADEADTVAGGVDGAGGTEMVGAAAAAVGDAAGTASLITLRDYGSFGR